MTTDPAPAQDTDHRKARHLAMLEELATLSMALARSAAQKAQAHLEDEAPAEPGKDPVLTFTRLTQSVRHLIALEARIANPARQPPAGDRPPAGDKPQAGDRRPTGYAPPKPKDEARELIAEAVRACAKADPAAIRRHGPTKTHIERHIDQRVAADDIGTMIGANQNVVDIIETICNDLEINFNIAQQPDRNLFPIERAVEIRRRPKTAEFLFLIPPSNPRRRDPT